MTGFAEFIQSVRGGPEDRPDALTRSLLAVDREPEDPFAVDGDERQAAMLTRGYSPGLLSQLHQRLAETETQLADEETKIEKAARRAERTRQMHERGQIDASGIIARMIDTDEGDQATVDRLKRRAGRLRQQLTEASAAITPQRERRLDGVEAASRHARRTLAEVTSQRTAQAGRPEPRPFASRGGVAVRSEQCIHCITNGVSDEVSFLLHSDPELNVPVTSPGQADVAPYAPGAVITTDYEQLRSEDGGPVIYR